MSRKTLETIIRILIAILTAFLTALGTISCINNFLNF